jgi:hypothetical protein
MATLVIPGTPDPRRDPSELGRGLPPTMVATKHATRVESARAAAVPLRLTDVQPDDVVEIELEDGIRVWSRVDDLAEDFRLPIARDAGDGVIALPPMLPIGPPSRGFAAWGIKALKVVGIDIAQSIGAFVADHVEGQLKPGPGLYRCSLSGGDLTPVGPMKGPGPTLVFLHGTASSTTGSFGKLWEGRANAPMQRLFERYDGRVLALQHRTLTESPIGNAAFVAARLLEIVDEGAEIHLVSHSRGGLVGELLARGMRVGSVPFTDEDLALFKDPARERDRAALASLNDILRRARFQVKRFVRVGCPARGTTLADGRLDRYFSILVNVVGMIPGLKANPVYDGLTSLLAGVLKLRTQPEELPGLEAQMPGSPLVRMLNRPGVETTADLHVLGGDLEGTGLLGHLKTFATDLYYREDHDLVVNTPSMFGGMDRTDGVRYWIDTGPEVTHFNYFARADTAGRLVAALTTDRADYHELKAEPFAVTASDYRKRAPIPQPVVFVLPGIMGSELSIAGRPVWVHMVALAAGGLAALRLGAVVQATGLVGSGYAALCRYLAASHEVVPFPYDWRVSIEESAARLREALEATLPDAEANGQPIRLLAHSMGGLVVRAMLATPDGQATWARICRHPDARFIMLGTPNQGSHSIPAMLIGRDALVKKLALLDLRNSYAELLTTITAFPGVLELLPYSGTLDLLDTAAWQTLYDQDVPSDRGLFSSSVETSKSAGFAWTRPAAAALAQARAVRDKILGSPLDASRMLYVAGVADETACDVEVDGGAPPGRRVRVHASAYGDGRVLWKTGIPAGLPVYYMDAVHGDLAATESAFPALVELLTTGKTSQLAMTPPARRSAPSETFVMRNVLPSMIPDREELVASALGARRRLDGVASTERRIRVRVVHDDVVNATSPVLVGHYEHDAIIGGEAYLDAQLSGRLTELRDMELYPGPIGTAVVALNSPGASLETHPGAVVAGLGLVGDLTPGRLTTTLAQALTTYGAERVGVERRLRQRRGEKEHQRETLELRVSALLVGSGEAGVSLVDSIQALLRAVMLANERLQAGVVRASQEGGAEGGPALTAQIARVEIIELYEDRAIEAVHALRTLSRSGEMARFVIDEVLAHGDAGRRRARFDTSPGWWQRVRITTRNDGSLRLEPLTQVARIPAHVQPTQRRAVSAFLQRATTTTAYERSLGYTLFEMLVPNDFKMHAADGRHLLLMLDPRAAAFPWELLHDRFDHGARPLAVASGMVRQLLVDRARDRVMRASGSTAFVLGNPVVTDKRFASLPGASDEARAVSAVLRQHQYEVVELVGTDATPMAVLSTLHARPWRIVHLAAHGVFDFEPAPGEPRVSGLVLDEGVFFTAADAEQLRHVPDLMFINCCHLGQTAGEALLFTAFHELAANLAVQLIRMGVRAVVAAGWAVDDAAAKTFARTFYEEMFDGQMFGDAVARARARIFEQHGSTNTWGAYQCYGDPSFSLVKSSRRGIVDPAVSDVETIITLEDICRQARTADQPGRAALLRDVEALVNATPQAWWRSARLCTAAAGAYGELRQFEAAIRYYEMVTAVDKADAPIEALEQLANLRVRWATELAQTDPAKRPEALDHLQRAQRLLKALVEIGETNERYSMLGSLEKRRALLTTGADRTQALADMEAAYRAAYGIARTLGASAVAYSLSNALAAKITLLWALPDDAARKTARLAIDESLTALKDAATQLADSSTDFFDLSAQGTATLLAALATGALDDAARRQVLGEYRQAASRGASPRHLASMREQVAFFEDMAKSEMPVPAQRDALVASLGHLRGALGE